MRFSMHLSLTGYSLFAIVALLACSGADASVPLTLDDFLHEVRVNNRAYQGSTEVREGSTGRVSEADLLTAPSFFANFQYESDSKLPVLPSFTYDHVSTENFSLGVNKQFDFGLKAKVYYAYDYTGYVDAAIPGVTGLDPSFFTPRDARPVIELSLQVLGGGFGRTVRANEELQEFQARTDAANAETQLRNILVQAESAYWQLATSRDIVAIEERAVREAQATYDYNERKAKMNLAESSDVLQSDAALQSSKLSLKKANDNEHAAERAFNLVRNARPETVPEELAVLKWDSIEGSDIPKIRPGNRSDVDAAATEQRVTDANSKIAIENDKPTLELYGSYAINGRSYNSYEAALANSFDSGRPTSIGGLRFNMPLDFSAQSVARRGAELQAVGADRVTNRR